MVASLRAVSPGAIQTPAAASNALLIEDSPETADEDHDLATLTDSDGADAHLLGQTSRPVIAVDGAARNFRCHAAAVPRRLVKVVLLVGTLVSLSAAALLFSTRDNPLRPKTGMPWRHITGYAEASSKPGARIMLDDGTKQMGVNAMGTLDKNEDDTASLSEVQTFAHEKGLDYASTLAEFAGFDQDKDGNLDEDELGQALGEGVAGMATLPPSMLCGSIVCEANWVCCHGICGPPNWSCCGSITCNPTSVCCPGLLNGTHICCSSGFQCCGGVCVDNSTYCYTDFQ
jgi:hypothetical protein